MYKKEPLFILSLLPSNSNNSIHLSTIFILRPKSTAIMPTDAKSRTAAQKGFGVPNRIGSLNFCPTCGNLLDVPKDDDVITCVQCGHTEDALREP